MRLHYLQHIELEHPGHILSWAEENGHVITHTRFYNQESLPSLNSIDWLVVMGGPMNIYEEDHYPWLKEEKAFISEAISSGKIVIGFCLGAQLIADCLGGKVTRAEQPEIGWLSIRWNSLASEHPLFSFFPRSSVVFQWHYDTFSVLPAEVKVLAESECCNHQAFMYHERVFGFQFHLENTPELVHGYIKAGAAEMKPAAYVQSPQEVMKHPEYIELNNFWIAKFLTRLQMQERRYIVG